MGARPSSFTLTSPGRLRLYSTAELLTMPPPDWMVDGILPEGGLAVLYGPPESFKSFVAVDLALCIATGLPWHGHTVQKGYSIYIAAEGGPGISKRVRAWLQHRNVKPSNLDIAWLIESVMVQHGSDDIERLMERFDQELNRIPTLIVIDTLARCFEGDENTQEDMNGFVGAIDHLRHEYGTAVLALHHVRVDGVRERGSGALRGGLDTMMSIDREPESDVITLKCAKQKDAEHFNDLTLRRLTVEGSNSCVMVDDKTHRFDVLRSILVQHGSLTATEFQKLASINSIPKATFYRMLRETVKNREIVKENGVYTLNQSHPL